MNRFLSSLNLALFGFNLRGALIELPNGRAWLVLLLCIAMAINLAAVASLNRANA